MWTLLYHYLSLKGEIRNRFNLISEERVNNFEPNSEKLTKNQLENKEIYDNLKFRKFSRNISWPVDMNMQISELMMSSPHNFPFHSVHRNDNNFPYFNY